IVEPAAGGAVGNGLAPDGTDQVGTATGTGTPVAAGDAGLARGGGEAAQDAEAAERRGGVGELARRGVAGGGGGLPVLFAVMAHDLFKAGWVPSVLLNHWFQFALITPVMFYTGWPIHRTGWLALSHRSADMNSLITIGTVAAYGYSLVVTLAPGLLP